MKPVAVILSGCGVFDGAEIHESVLTLLALDRHNASYQCLAPNITQTRVINHLTQQPTSETRNVLIEAARIARGDIIDLATANPDDYSAAIFPGGFGAALNLSSFALLGAQCQIQPDVLRFSRAMLAQKKPLGFICIAPAMIPLIAGPDVKLTIGHDCDTAAQISAMGGQPIDCDVHHIVIDATHRIVSTPAYMLASRISEAATGIERLVAEVLALR